MKSQKLFYITTFLCFASTVSARAYYCSECCLPSSFFESLPIIFEVSGVLLIALVALVWNQCYVADYKRKKQASFDENFQYSGNIPFSGLFYYQSHFLENGQWVKKPDCTIQITDSSAIEIVGLKNDLIPEKFECQISNNTKSKVKFSVGEGEQSNIGKKDEIILYLTKVPGSDKPGFVAVYSQDYKAYFVLLPIECQASLSSFFPIVKSKFLMLYFGLIILSIFLSVLTFCFSRSTFFYSNYYPDYLYGYPWGAFCSCFGIIVFFIFSNPFGWQIVQISNRKWVSALFTFYWTLSIVCLLSAFTDLIYESFIDDNNLVETGGTYSLTDHLEEFKTQCQFNQYDCSVTYSGNMTYRDDSCQDDYVLQCFSFNTDNNSCSDERDDFVVLLVFQALFEYSLVMLWMVVTYIWRQLNKDRWHGISMKLEELNGRNDDKIKESPVVNNPNNARFF